MNSGFCYKADENSTFLVYYTVSSGIFLATFRENLLVPSSRVP